MRALVEERLWHVLERKHPEKPFKLRDARYRGPGEGLSPEFADGDWARIRAAIYEGRGVATA